MTIRSDQVPAFFAGLEQFGSLRVTDQWTGDGLLQWVVTLELDEIKIRVSLERQIPFIEIASVSTDEWFDLDLWLRFLERGTDDPQGTVDPARRLSELVETVSALYPKFRSLLSPMEVERTIQALRRMRLERARSRYGAELK